MVKDPLYCYCQMPDDHSLMIECSNSKCKIGWFHGKCVSLSNEFYKKEITGEWYCGDCTCERLSDFVKYRKWR